MNLLCRQTFAVIAHITPSEMEGMKNRTKAFPYLLLPIDGALRLSLLVLSQSKVPILAGLDYLTNTLLVTATMRTHRQQSQWVPVPVRPPSLSSKILHPPIPSHRMRTRRCFHLAIHCAGSLVWDGAEPQPKFLLPRRLKFPKKARRSMMICRHLDYPHQPLLQSSVPLLQRQNNLSYASRSSFQGENLLCHRLLAMLPPLSRRIVRIVRSRVQAVSRLFVKCTLLKPRSDLPHGLFWALEAATLGPNSQHPPRQQRPKTNQHYLSIEMTSLLMRR